MTTPKTAALIFVVTMFSSLSMAQPKMTFSFSDGYGYYFSEAMDSNTVKTIVGKDTTTNLSPFSAMVVFTILQTWDAYLVWCADSVQKKGWDSWVLDPDASRKDSIKIGGKWVVGSYSAKVQHNYYRDVRETPSFYGYIEWLRRKAKGVPQ